MKRLIMATSGLLLVVIGLVALRQPEPREITVMLPDSAGLFVGNDVGVLGIPIGRVVSLEPKGSSVEAHLEITDDTIKIPANAGAVVVTRSIAADRYVEITPVYDGGPTMEAGAVIPASRAATPVDFDNVLSSVTKLGDDLTRNPEVATNLRDLIDASATTLDGNGQAMHEATTSLSAAMTEVNGQRHTIVGTVQSLTTLATALNANEAAVRQFVTNLTDAASLLSDERTNIGAALTSLSASIDDVSRLANTHRGAIKTDITGLTTTMQNTLKSKDDLEEALDTLPLLGQNMQKAAPNGRLRFHQDPTTLTPLGPYMDDLCKDMESVCNSLAVTLNPTTLTGIIVSLLTSGGVG